MNARIAEAMRAAAGISGDRRRKAVESSPSDDREEGLAKSRSEAVSLALLGTEQTSGFATLDRMSCYVIANQAKFEPALGADGKPVKSASFQRVNWRIRS